MGGSDATVSVSGALLDIVDDEWRADTLPDDGTCEQARVKPEDPTETLCRVEGQVDI